MNQQIDELLLELRKVQEQIQPLEAKEEELRKDIFGRMENEGLIDGYSNDIATVSYKTTKKVEYDKDKMLDALMEKNCVRYFANTILPTFEKDIKDNKLTPAMGVFTEEDIEIKTSNSIAVKFK